ncbi:MAG: hypothetical protein HY864_08365 [Chloroflexi bacterium]|nr:hypothetical protein [Chloroflexota bacterium]
MNKNQKFLILFFLTSTLILFLGFYRNQWNIATKGKFRNFQKDDQALVIGRMVETRQNGLLSHSGFLGIGDSELFMIDTEKYEEEIMYEYQYDSYLKGKVFSNNFSIYPSQTGVQGLFFGILDVISPFPPPENLRLYRIITSLSFAIVLGFILTWFFSEFGWVTATFALIGCVTSPWLTVIGRNLFYFPTFFYLPMVAAIYYLKKFPVENEKVLRQFGVVIFASVFLKCLFNGFDFIIPSILMISAPYIYYAIRDRWRTKKFINVGITISIASTIAIFLTLVILSIQIWNSSSNYSEAIGYITNRLNERTIGTISGAVGTEGTIKDVLVIYFFDKVVFKEETIRFIDLINVFAISTILYVILKTLIEKSIRIPRQMLALIITTWASILSPLLWYVIFRGQAYVHTHTNFLAWYMPFVIFGFALCGYFFESLLYNKK